MASHVVVLDSTARRAVIKTTPTKHLSDVLQEACAKLGLDPSRHGLKNGKDKTLDLSQPMRLAGISSGAKLQLVVLSRSPSVVSVALQLPDSEAGGSSRITDKFASTTTLWLLLRHFESSSEVARNFTARGITQVGGGGATGAGRLYYETPVIHIMERELSSFTDLQRSLAQLGFNSGNVLLRLSFRGTEIPLEEAMVDIDSYFKAVEGEATGGAHAGSVGDGEATLAPETSEIVLAKKDSEVSSPPELETPSVNRPPFSPRTEMEAPEPSFGPNNLAHPSPPSESTIPGPEQRPVLIYAPPKSSAPAATRHAHNEKDYEPTIDHAKLHQQRLSQYGRNKPLPSDAELAAQAEAQAKKNANVIEVRIKVRFPDQSQAISTFTNFDTTATLYEYVKGLMYNENELFSLSFPTNKGPKIIPKDTNVKLIQGLEMTGAVLVNFVWEAEASMETRQGKILKAEYQERATEIPVNEPEPVEVEDEDQAGNKGKRKVGDVGEKKKGGVPKWLKLPGKK